MKDESRIPVAHFVFGALRKDRTGYGTASPAEVTKIGRFATEGIVSQAQTDLLKVKP
jgi:hypothetical protein